MDYDIDVPKFCSQCGGKMILGKKEVNSYSEKTGGVKSYEYDVKCEEICGWKGVLNWLKNHDDFLIIDTPYNLITKKPHRTILEKCF